MELKDRQIKGRWRRRRRRRRAVPCHANRGDAKNSSQSNALLDTLTPRSDYI